MTKQTRASFILLLSVPLLLGAVASKRGALKKDIAVGQDAQKAASDVHGQPTPTSLPPTIETPSVSVGNPTPVTSSSAASYAIDWYSINGGGTVNATSTNYKMGASVGQSVAGEASSASYKMGIGFWYGASGGGCACNCHADPMPASCDGVQDVTDVVATIGVAFRGNAPILDGNAGCPWERTDTNCSSSTDVVDVVKMVNVAFRGANPATEFCNPCP